MAQRRHKRLKVNDKPFVNLCVFSVNLCVTAKKAMLQNAQRRHKRHKERENPL